MKQPTRADVKEIPHTSKEGQPCPHCSGTLRLTRVKTRVYLECDKHPLHYRLATPAEIASMKG